LSRQLDWQSLGIELPKEQTVHLSPRARDFFRRLPQAVAPRGVQAHNALDRYSFRFAFVRTVLGSKRYRWIPFTGV
jgi:hypothetical protein